MDPLFYTKQQLRVFSQDLLQAFVSSGFEIVEEPHIDYALFGFRATYMRRYLVQQPTLCDDIVHNTIIHVVGLPFGRQGKKMFVLSAPRDIKNQPIAETLKIRLQFDDDGSACAVFGEKNRQHPSSHNTNEWEYNNDRFDVDPSEHALQAQLNLRLLGNTSGRYNSGTQLANQLNNYVKQLIEIISPGLILLPTEMKLEILKKLDVDSIIRMAQVNNEFRSIIFRHGETLWRHLCLRDFNIRNINRLMHRSWMELYRDSFILQQIEICRKERALPGPPERPALPPVPYRLQIEWLPEVLELPFYHIRNVAEQENNRLQLALELFPLRRADDLDQIQ